MAVAATAMTLAVSVWGAPAGADVPQRDLPPSETVEEFVAPAEDHCGFDVRVETDGKSEIILFGERAQILSPGLKVTLTNLENPDRQVTYSISGPSRARTVWHDDGTATLTQISTGPWIYLLPGDPIVTTHGRVVETVEFDASGGVLDVQLDTTTARVIDVCEVLS